MSPEEGPRTRQPLPEGASVGYPRETAEETKARGGKAFFAMFETPFYDVWAHAAIAEILSGLYERVVVEGQRG